MRKYELFFCSFRNPAQHMKYHLSFLVAALLLLGAGLVFFDRNNEDVETITKLFNVNADDLSDASVTIINKHTGKEPDGFTIPDQDPAYCAEGFFRLPYFQTYRPAFRGIGIGNTVQIDTGQNTVPFHREKVAVRIPEGFQGGALDFASSIFSWVIFHLTYSFKYIGAGILVLFTMGMMYLNRVRIIKASGNKNK